MNENGLTFPAAVLIVIAAMLFVSALLAVYRMVRGTSTVDRAVGNDLLVSTVVCMLGVQAATERDGHTLTLLITLSLVGFISSVAVGRFATHDDDGIPQESIGTAVEPDDVHAPASAPESGSGHVGKEEELR